MTDGDPWLFATRPISGGLLLAAVLSVDLNVRAVEALVQSGAGDLATSAPPETQPRRG